MRPEPAGRRHQTPEPAGRRTSDTGAGWPATSDTGAGWPGSVWAEDATERFVFGVRLLVDGIAAHSVVS